ncbi:MAG: DUF3445 domain-containing protein [Planctomycetes bacterium]|nr:DUF3445 domain-containing protein [Planctomycetota bacterium]
MTVISLDGRWFADEDFRFRVGTVPGTAEDFFAHSAEAAEALAERRHWLTTDPELYAAILPAGSPIAEEFLEVAATWPMLRQAPADTWNQKIPLFDRLLRLSEQLEPDFVLLAPNHPKDGSVQSDEFTVVGGCVCFPSTWRLTDKLGQSVAEVHEPVPDLNSVLAAQIDRLIARLRPGKCVVRANWSVCRTPERNQHPSRNLPGIESPATLDGAWLRREDQCLLALPKTGGVVFGIRVTHISWHDLRTDSAAAHSVARALRTMPLRMQVYKRLDAVSEELATLLE